MAQLNPLEKFKLQIARQSERLFSSADIVISISDFLQKDLYERTGLESIVIPPGIDIDISAILLKDEKQ